MEGSGEGKEERGRKERRRRNSREKGIVFTVPKLCFLRNQSQQGGMVRERALPPFLLPFQLVLERDQRTEMLQMLLKLYGYWTWNEEVLMIGNLGPK